MNLHDSFDRHLSCGKLAVLLHCIHGCVSFMGVLLISVFLVVQLNVGDQLLLWLLVENEKHCV